ncbi:MAG: hypothetical protein JRD88_06495 [Deltaproteobacteria bacterium]|jgi:hypothetical protein|nr:hypothetical protein [Deltaproteobacteria bacterium]
MKSANQRLILSFVLALITTFLFPPANAIANGKWWDVVPENEAPSYYYDSILYSEIAPKLREIEVNSNRVKVDVLAESAGGRNLLIATISDPETSDAQDMFQEILVNMTKDPEKALALIDSDSDFKVPVVINGGTHGSEYTGVDAAVRVMEYLAYDVSEEVQTILENVIVIINVVQNPDGRVSGTLQNSANVDLDLDFMSQSQPETKALVSLIKEWNPLVFLDLHNKLYSVTPTTYVPNTMVIEPSGPYHNPNYEYDLYIKWALFEAFSMEDELFANTSETAIIPFRNGPCTTTQPQLTTSKYSMFHHTYGHTLETQYLDERGVDAHFWAIKGALKYVVENKKDMIRDQIQAFRRGALDLPQQPIPEYILTESNCNQYNDLTVQNFPVAYIIPENIAKYLLFNGVEVERTNDSFQYDEDNYPKGTYIVWMDQPRRVLANNFLEYRTDVVVIQGAFDIKTIKLNEASIK